MLVAVRLEIPVGVDEEWSITEAVGQADGPAMRDGKPLAGLSETTALLPIAAGACTVHFKAAAGPWSTIQSWGKSPGSLGDQGGRCYIFGRAIATPTGTTLSVTHNIQSGSVRLVAVGGDGEEILANVRSASGVKDFTQMVVEFDKRPDQIKEFRLQTRAYEEVDIPGIALQRK
jgi:hypothetical protein